MKKLGKKEHLLVARCPKITENKLDLGCLSDKQVPGTPYFVNSQKVLCVKEIISDNDAIFSGIFQEYKSSHKSLL